MPVKASDHVAPVVDVRPRGEAYAAPWAIKVPILVSAIGNIVVACVYISTCLLAILAIPCIVLCVFEFILYVRADELRPRDFVKRAQNMAIAEVVVGLINLVSLVCGIVILANAPTARRRVAGDP